MVDRLHAALGDDVTAAPGHYGQELPADGVSDRATEYRRPLDE
jgi:hypothetical protein